MANETLARRYAQAIFELAREAGNVERVGSDLHVVWDALQADEQSRRFFLAPVIDRIEKQTLLIDAFAGKIEDLALHALLLLAGKRRERFLPEILVQYDGLQRAERGVEPLVISSAHELSDEELATLTARLSRIYGKQFEVQQNVDASLLGGMKIKMGDVAVDGTVAGKLDELSRSLFTTQGNRP